MDRRNDWLETIGLITTLIDLLMDFFRLFRGFKLQLLSAKLYSFYQGTLQQTWVELRMMKM